MFKALLITGASMIALSIANYAAADDGAATTPTMSFGAWGFDPASLSPEIDPGDNFFAYANQRWLDANPLPADQSRFGVFNLLREKSTSDVQALVDDLVANNDGLPQSEKRIVDAYNAYLDTEAIDASGLAPARSYLDAIRGANTLAELASPWGTPHYASPLGGFVTVDAKEPSRYSVYFRSGGLGMPDRTYYTDDSEKGLGIQTKYRDFIAFLLGDADVADAVDMAQKIYDFEESIARTISWDRAVRRNRDLTYNAMTPQELHDLARDFPLDALLTANGLDSTDRFVITDLPPSTERAEELGLM